MPLIVAGLMIEVIIIALVKTISIRLLKILEKSLLWIKEFVNNKVGR